MSQHHITITGRITQEPSLRRVAGGNCVLDMRVASSRAVRDDEQESGWRDYDNLFLDVEAWGQLAVNTAASLHKGYPVVLVGSLVTQQWEDSEEKRHSKTVLKATHIAPDLAHYAAALTKRKADRDDNGGVVLNVEGVVFDQDALAGPSTSGFTDASATPFGEQSATDNKKANEQATDNAAVPVGAQ
ncbi:single-stranded DNA-binding protein [Corynebacterium propinquum]